jgi:hypothetical protein
VEPELSEYEQNWRDEAEYLSTLNNFHWLVYPFWKMIETFADKLCGCKRNVEAKNQMFRQARIDN